MFEPEFEGASHRFAWIAIDPWGRQAFYVADEATLATADPLSEVRELRRRRRARAERRLRARRAIQHKVVTRPAAQREVVTIYGPGPIIRQRRGARPRWLRAASSSVHPTRSTRLSAEHSARPRIIRAGRLWRDT